MEAKCEKCEHCKLITRYGCVFCDYLNSLSGIGAQGYMRPKMCRNFEKKKRNRRTNDED